MRVASRAARRGGFAGVRVGAVLIEAQWGTQTGTSNNAISDGGAFNSLIDGTPNSIPAMAVVAGSEAGWTRTPNVLQMTMAGQSYSLVRNTTALAAATDWNCRVYIRVLDADDAWTNHPYKTDWRGSNSIILWSLQSRDGVAQTYRPAVRVTGSKWVDPTFSYSGDINFLGPVLSYGKFYRFEHRVVFVGDPSLGRAVAHVRVFDESVSATVPIAQSSDFVFTRDSSPFDSHDLQTSIDAGAYYQAANVDGYLAGCFRQPTMGYEGPAGMPTTTERYFFAAYAAGTGGWLGAV